MPEKNSLYETVVDSMSSVGYGVCRVEGLICFVKGGVTGDRLLIKLIKVNKNYCVGRVERVIESSTLRREPRCPVFKKCGGCAFMHVDYAYELELKKSFVEAEFKKAGLAVDVADVYSTGETARYRNKASYPVDSNCRIGFYAERSHEICEIDDCLLQPEIFSQIVGVVKDHMKTYGVSGYDESTGKGVLRRLYARKGGQTDEIHVTLVTNGRTLPHSDELSATLKTVPGVVGASLNVNAKNTNVILGDEYIPLFGKEYIEDVLCGLRFRISPASFYQINRDCAEALYGKVAQMVKAGKCDSVVDLYCGTGTIGLSVASQIESCKLTGVEIVPEAVENASFNAKENGIDNAKFICADSADAGRALGSADVVILDPPRKGIAKQLADEISNAGVKKVVYVSCSPDTLARDVKYFAELGYSCGQAFPFDMFPRTGHVETVVELRRENR